MAFEKQIGAPDEALLQKYNDLLSLFRQLGSAAVAFSSGVDSTFLLYAAKEALGDNVIAMTAASDTFPQREKLEAIEFCRQMGVLHFIMETNELEIPGFAENPPDRCYLCKKTLFTGFMELAEEQHMACVVEGSNLDDNGDYRPGHRAIEDLGIVSPLRDVGFTKQEIRILSAHFGLPTWSKPSFACLASRFPYGETITREKLSMVEKSEELLMELGFKQFRVRIHGNLARIELLPEDLDRFMNEEIRLKVDAAFHAIGFSYTALDIRGYRTGSMNETLGLQ